MSPYSSWRRHRVLHVPADLLPDLLPLMKVAPFDLIDLFDLTRMDTEYFEISSSKPLDRSGVVKQFTARADRACENLLVLDFAGGGKTAMRDFA